MINTAFIKIWGETIGAVAWDENTKLASFEFDPAFIAKRQDLSPIRMPITSGNQIFSFPERRNTTTFNGLPGLLADSLPDRYGNQLIDAWLAQQGRPANSMNPVEKLCFIGTRGMGALEFHPAHFKTAKNTAFRLKENGQWELAPAYDVSYAYRASSKWVSQHALSINGKRENITKHDLLTVANSMNIKKAGQTIKQISQIIQNWPQYAEQTKVESQKRDVITTTLVSIS